MGGNLAVKCAVWIIAGVCLQVSAFERKFSGERHRGSFGVKNKLLRESTCRKSLLPHVKAQPLLKIQLRNKLIKIKLD